mmetsp:Transcript_29857/g.55943  ORF Transcript_29857/g.55943 Transcript_29857/m.55943 type:complete len:268 (+) Transcript_29857:44-847(+)
MSARPRGPGPRRSRLCWLAILGAALVLARLRPEGGFSLPWQRSNEGLSRRDIASLGAAASLASASPLPAEAIFGLWEGPKLNPFTMSGVYNISMPPKYKLKKNVTGLLAWQGDRMQPTEVMTAKAKAVPYTRLAQALGSNVTEVGLKMAAVRPSVRIGSTIEAQLMEAVVDPNEKGLDIYRFEFLSDFIHEYKLYALVSAQGANYLCSVNVRTPALLWTENKELFDYILKSFTPLEPQPNRSADESTPVPAASMTAAETSAESIAAL